MNILKLIDKFLKILKTDRNTFFTYILTLATIYIVVDRFVELLFLVFTGISVSYWGPIVYTFALACPIFAFLFSGSSKFADSQSIKISFFYLYCISLYIIGISMAVQWFNAICWLLLLSVPNYVELVTNFSELIKPAFSALALYLPLTTFYTLFKFLYTGVNDSKKWLDSIKEYSGININQSKGATGAYTCEITLCKDFVSGKIVKTPESKRFESTLVIGVSGSGKTSMIFEPMMARDLEKKYFFREISKEMGFTALKTGIATLNRPYNNDYLNKNFDLNMLTVNPYKEKVFKSYMNKMIYSNSGNIVYKNLGFTYIAPDYESISHILEVAENYGLKVNLIDPSNPNSIGLNPFVSNDPSKIAITISSVLKGMYFSSHSDVEEAFRENVTMQAIENLTILLKEMYPRLNDGLLPNLEDLLEMLNDFDLVEEMCTELMVHEELTHKYRIQLGYFKKNFFKNSIGRADTEKYVYSAVTQLDNLLRFPGVKAILCNRNYNVNFDNTLANGEITLVCTRRGDLGPTAHKAFGLFFILTMQQAILTRPGNERTRIPHFIYIDEFPDFICKATDSMFTLYRKYRVGLIISAQNLDQLGNKSTSKYRQTILANSSTKIVFGNNTPEDNEWWELELATKNEWVFKADYETDKGSYSPKLGDIKRARKPNFYYYKIQDLKFKECVYKTKDLAGKNIVGKGKVDFLESKYSSEHRSKKYNFSKFTGGILESDEEPKKRKNKFNPKYVNFDNDDNEIDPIQTDTTDSTYLFDNEDAISINFRKK